MARQDFMRGPAGGRLSEAAREQARTQLLDPAQPVTNVIGFGSGIKWTNGEPTGRPAMLVFVTSKVPESGLAGRDVVPQAMDDGTPTDVIAIGHIAAQQRVLGAQEMRVPDRLLEGRAGEAPAAEVAGLLEAEPQLLSRRMRPCPSGFSIGNVGIPAGTLGSVVYDFQPGATIDPPAPGLGMPSRYYVLSSNHVLAASNAAPIGSAIVQPGPFDGGADPRDRIATLSRFVPIQFAPQVPLDRHNNVVDAALGQEEFADATREIYFSGAPRAWRRKANVAVGDKVRKTGRTTNVTFGRILSVDAIVDVSYGPSGVARFHDQVITTAMASGGDSGSLVTSYDNVAIGLLFAGSPLATIVNHIETVRSLLRVEIAELLA
jgi:hypothetical protein